MDELELAREIVNTARQADENNKAAIERARKKIAELKRDNPEAAKLLFQMFGCDR